MQKGFQVELVASAPYHSPHRPGSGEPSPQPSKRTVAILDDLAEDRQYDLQSLPELLDLCMPSRSAPPGLMLHGRNGCACVTCALHKYCLGLTRMAFQSTHLSHATSTITIRTFRASSCTEHVAPQTPKTLQPTLTSMDAPPSLSMLKYL